ncbi:MAG: competence type IV pilus major pilin ComGC [Bacillaceae bacterium]
MKIVAMLKNKKGFTLVEMLIVMLVISVLLLLTIPNISKQSEGINDKGCDAFVSTVTAQVQAYHLENKAYPTDVNALKAANYLTTTKCSDGHVISIGEDGSVTHTIGE